MNNAVVMCTEDRADASPFYVIPDTWHYNQFHITHYDDGEPQIPYYLTTRTDHHGEEDGPLCLQMVIDDEQNTRFVLHSRFHHRWRNPIQGIRSWVELTEAYYIKCCPRFLKFRGYICIQEADSKYRTSCVRNIGHNDRMLFQLQHY